MPTTDSHFAVAGSGAGALDAGMADHILVLGGTTEARQLCERLAGSLPGARITLSLAGRTASPLAAAVPVRSGGFGGADGLARWLRDEGATLLIDATHPFAARISANAAAAVSATGIPLIALRRPPWKKVGGDTWIECDSIVEAVHMLGPAPRRVFVAVGRQELEPLAIAPQHHYLIRSVDPVRAPLSIPNAQLVLARGPFAVADEERVLRDHCIDAILAKNSGGAATYGKIEAARRLGIAVHLVRRPALPDAATARDVDEVLAMAAHVLASAKRGE